jgi:chromate transporter
VGDTARPASPAAMFRAFHRLSMQGFGGVLPVAQRELVERLRWLTREQFLELLSLSQVLPGPNIINLGLIFGDRHFGWRGAVAATAGLLLGPLLLVIVLAALAVQWRHLPQVAGALHGMGVVAAGLVLSTAIKLGKALRHSGLGVPAAALLVAATGRRRPALAAGLGGAGPGRRGHGPGLVAPAAVIHEFVFGALGHGWPQWLQLFAHFLMLSLLAIGGAITTVPDMQRYVVGEQGWLDDAQFSNCIALGQAAPGPNVLFVAVIGYSVGGLMGVAATLAGTLLPSTTLALTVSRWGDRRQDSRLLKAFTTGMAPLTIGLLLATGWILLEPVRLHAASVGLLVLTLGVMLFTKLSPMWLVGLGLLAGAAGWL